MNYFLKDDYFAKIVKPKRCKQSIIPKVPKDYNGSKSIPIEIPRDFQHFKKAKDLKNDT